MPVVPPLQRSAVRLSAPMALAALAAAGSLLSPVPVSAQAESFLVGPGSSVGPSTRVKPTNCVTAPDGSITCDTQLENSPSDTQARPQFEPFKN